MKAGPRRETRARAEQAARLRACGFTWQAIADHCGYRSRQAAQWAVSAHYDRNRETPELARRSLAEGLRLVETTLFESLAESKKKGDVAGISSMSREILRVTKELANLDGLHAPQQVEVQVTHHRSLSEILAEAQQAMMAAFDAEEGVNQPIDAEVVEITDGR